MDSHRKAWNVLNWNIRGLNEEDKQRAVRAKVQESVCDIFCIQETKMEVISPSFIKKLAPKRFNKFIASPSHGASGGLLMCWNDRSKQVLNNSLLLLKAQWESWKLTVLVRGMKGIISSIGFSIWTSLQMRTGWLLGTSIFTGPVKTETVQVAVSLIWTLLMRSSVI